MTAPNQYPPTSHRTVPYPHGPYQQGPYRGPYPPYQQGPYGAPGFAPPRTGLTQPWAIALVVVVVITVLAGVVLAASASTGQGSGATRGSDTGVGDTGPVGRQGGTGQQGGGQGEQRGQGTTECPGGSLEGCYTEGEMQAFLNQAIRFVHGFSEDRYTRMPHPSGYRLIGPNERAQSACGALDTMTYAFCPADDGIYIGQKQLWQFYSEIGDAAAVVGLAHEYGHHIQHVAGVPRSTDPRSEIAHENQADCIAGAFVGWAEEQGFLEDSDTQDIAGLVRAIASSENDPNRDHGTLAEREASMATGIRQGLPGCSAFFPETPVHQAG